MSQPIPTQITIEQYIEATKAFCDVLGINHMAVYTAQPLVISEKEITFCTVANYPLDGNDTAGEEFPPGTRAYPGHLHPQGDEATMFGELAQMVSIEVLR